MYNYVPNTVLIALVACKLDSNVICHNLFPRNNELINKQCNLTKRTPEYGDKLGIKTTILEDRVGLLFRRNQCQPTNETTFL